MRGSRHAFEVSSSIAFENVASISGSILGRWEETPTHKAVIEALIFVNNVMMTCHRRVMNDVGVKYEVSAVSMRCIQWCVPRSGM